MPIFIRKRTILLSLVVVLLASAVLINDPRPKTTEQPLPAAQDKKDSQFIERQVNAELAPIREELLRSSTNQTNEEFFSDYRMKRDRARSQQIEYYREIINNQNYTEEVRREAHQKIFEITNNLGKELEIENLVVAQGYLDAVAFIQPQTVAVVIKSALITADDTRKISDIIIRTTKYRPEDLILFAKQ